MQKINMPFQAEGRTAMVNERSAELGLDALLEQDISSFEFYNTLSDEMKRKLKAKDIRSFEEMQDCVDEMRLKREL